MAKKKKSNSPAKKSPRTAGSPATTGSEATPTRPRRATSPEAIREIVESVVIAFILAFLFRTFEAEAFVIPTGSMAPTLMGRHKDVICEKCGYPYQASASSEVDNKTNRRNNTDVIRCTCPICRYPMDVGPTNAQGKSYPSYKGDRILVGKFSYEFRDPRRWEVAVFKFPLEAKTNYIKRIVGLPNETIRVSRGDIHVRPHGEETFTVARKPDAQLLSMLQPVDDADYALSDLIRLGWPSRWIDPAPKQAGAWTTEDHRSYATDGSGGAPVELRYQHIVPTAEDWSYLAKNQLPGGGERKRPQLISDFTSYNSDYRVTPDFGNHLISAFHNSSYGLNWVSDLAVQFEVAIGDGEGTFQLEMIRGGRSLRCRIDPSAATATLAIDGDIAFGTPTANVAIHPGGTYELLFSNVDDELRLWVDGDRVEFNAPTTYDAAGLGCFIPTAEDLHPIRVVSDGLALRLTHLKVHRDIYYLAKNVRSSGKESDFVVPNSDPFGLNYRSDMEGDKKVGTFLSDPEDWPKCFAKLDQVEFSMGPGQFFAMGDNSSQSQDSRLWGEPHYVSRELLIGKALLIYWPHMWEIPGTGIPAIPNFQRMWFVE